MSDHVDPYRSYLGLPTPDGLDVMHKGLNLGYILRKTDARKVLKELKTLLKDYKTEIWLGHRHCAPSPTWRDESVLERDAKARFAIRVHLFEKAPHDAPGRYLGFAAVRPAAMPQLPPRTPPRKQRGFQYLLEAEVVPPRRMLRPRYHLVTTTASSARLGVLPFRSAVFVAVPNDPQRKSTCTHAAISQALHLTMGRFGTRPISHREFEAMLWKLKEGAVSVDEIARKGVSLADALDVCRERCHAGGFIASFLADNTDQSSQEAIKREALRCITDALANGLPVILEVDYRTLNKRFLGPGQRKPHATLLLGMHLLHSPAEVGQIVQAHGTREDEAEIPGRLVGHDMIRGPFAEWTSEEVLEAARQATRKANTIRFLVLGPPQLTLGLHEVRRQAKAKCARDDAKTLLAYHKTHGNLTDAYSPWEWRFVTRLIDPHEMQERYKTPKNEKTINHFVKDDPDTPLWCVEVRHPQPKKQKNRGEPPPAIVYVWQASDDPDAAPRLTLRWT